MAQLCLVCQSLVGPSQRGPGQSRDQIDAFLLNKTGALCSSEFWRRPGHPGPGLDEQEVHMWGSPERSIDDKVSGHGSQEENSQNGLPDVNLISL